MIVELPEYGDENYRGSEEIEGEFRAGPICVAFGRVIETLALQMKIQPACESPIEVQLGAELMRRLPSGFRLEPQYPFQGFRMDFAVIAPAGNACLFIECDGKAFHSTREQKANDRAKDASAALMQIPLLRFTGSNIFRDAAGCARAVVSLVEGLA